MGERQKKTPEQRALEALGTAERVYAKAKDKLTEAAKATNEARTAVATTRARLEYVAIHPDLPEAERERVAAVLNPPPQPEPVGDEPGPDVDA